MRYSRAEWTRKQLGLYLELAEASPEVPLQELRDGFVSWSGMSYHPETLRPIIKNYFSCVITLSAICYHAIFADLKKFSSKIEPWIPSSTDPVFNFFIIAVTFFRSEDVSKVDKEIVKGVSCVLTANFNNHILLVTKFVCTL